MSERLVAGFLGVTAFGLYAGGAVATPHLLDSAELVAAGYGFGLPHPPGEVLSVLWIRAFMLLPLGSLAFRAALAQAAAGAIAVVLVFTLARWTLRALGAALPAGRGPSASQATLLAGAGALLYAGAPGVTNAAVRPEVYAPATALALGALACAWQARAQGEPRRALLAALLVGLGLTNHPLIAGSAALAAVSAAWPLASARPRAAAAAAKGSSPGPSRHRLLALAPLALGLGLSPIVYLPARSFALHAAGADPDAAAETLVWGDARTPSGLGWILSARTFAAKAALVHGRDMPGALPFMLVEELGLPGVLLALVGLYGLVRLARQRALGGSLLVGLAAVAGAALVAGLDPSNPDIRGYLGAALGLGAVLATAGAACVLALVRAQQRTLLAGGLLLLAAAEAARGTARDPLWQARAVHRSTHALLAGLPPRAVLLTAHFETGFLVAHHRLVEGARPDVTWVHLGWSQGPGAATRLARARPVLAPVLAAQADPEALGAALRELARERPLRVEPGLGVLGVPGVDLVPDGWVWRVAAAGGTSAAWQATADGDAAGGPRFVSDVEADWSEVRAECARSRELRGHAGLRLSHDVRWACAHGLPQGPELSRELRWILPEDAQAAGLARSCARALEAGPR